MRRRFNPGKREREARKRRRACPGKMLVWASNWGAESVPLRLGPKHRRRTFSPIRTVSEDRKEANRSRSGAPIVGTSPG